MKRPIVALVSSVVAVLAVLATGLASPAASADQGVGSAASAIVKRSSNGKGELVSTIYRHSDGTRSVRLDASTVRGKVHKRAIKADRIVATVTVREDDSAAVTKRYVARNVRTLIVRPKQQGGHLSRNYPSTSILVELEFFENGKRIAKIRQTRL